MAFVGDHARENHEITRCTNTFCVPSNRTLIRRARPGDRALLHLAGEGFVEEARVSAPARTPDVTPEWSSKKLPLLAVSITNIRPFPEAIPYKSPGDGNHPALGFHRYSLTGGFLAVLKTGFEVVLGRAGPRGTASDRKKGRTEVPGKPALETTPRPGDLGHRSLPPGVSERGQRERENRTAGQHALSFGLIPGEGYEESFVVREPGDALVVYSEGFFDTYPGGVALEAISDALGDAKSASPMVECTIKLARLETIPRDDLTVMVLYCKPCLPEPSSPRGGPRLPKTPPRQTSRLAETRTVSPRRRTSRSMPRETPPVEPRDSPPPRSRAPLPAQPTKGRPRHSDDRTPQGPAALDNGPALPPVACPAGASQPKVSEVA